MRPQDQYTAPIIARITDKWFVTEPTSVYTGQWVYSWHEQYFDPSSGILADNPAGRIGTYDPLTDTAVAVLTEKNNRSLPVNAYVSLNQQGLVNGQPLYETATTSQVDVLEVISGPNESGLYLASVVTLNTLNEFETVTRVVVFTWPSTPPVSLTIAPGTKLLGLLVKSFDPNVPGDYDVYTGVPGGIGGAGLSVLKVTGSAGGGGYPFTVQQWNGSAWVDTDPPQSGSTLKELNNNEIPTGTLVWAQQTPDGTRWYCQYEPEPEPFYPPVSCGLDYEDGTEGQTLVVDLSGVVFDGLTFDSEICALSWRPGCGMAIVASESEPGQDAIGVDYPALAGDRNNTSLVVHDPVYPDPCKSLAVDLEPDPATEQIRHFMEDFAIELVAGTGGPNVRFSWNKIPTTVTKNLAGLPVIVEFGEAIPEEVELDLCQLMACCDAAILEVAGSREPSSGTTDTVFNFDATVTGGVGPYTYLWDFGDGETDAASPTSHIYVEAGEYSPLLTVTDGCGTEVTFGPGTITVTSGFPGGDCCSTTPPTLILEMSSSGCPCYAAASPITLTADGPNSYTGVATICGFEVTINFYCYSAPSWALDIIGGAGASATGEPFSCEPFSWAGSGSVFIVGVCEGETVDFTVTLPP